MDAQENDKSNGIYYLSHGNFGCVIYANTVDDAFEKMKAKRGKWMESLGVSLNISDWEIEEFTPDLYDGILCFY